jgi:hypothetical protein
MQSLNPTAARTSERRTHPRSPCSLKCGVAPYEAGYPLGDLKFELAVLNDIAVGGFSFWAIRLPRLAELAFMLADRPRTVMFLSQVRHVRRVDDRFIVGCQIVRLLCDSADPLVNIFRYAQLVPKNPRCIGVHSNSANRTAYPRSPRPTQIEFSGWLKNGDDSSFSGRSNDSVPLGTVAREFVSRDRRS